jgi:hypothetical protein
MIDPSNLANYLICATSTVGTVILWQKAGRFLLWGVVGAGLLGGFASLYFGQDQMLQLTMSVVDSTTQYELVLWAFLGWVGATLGYLIYTIGRLHGSYLALYGLSRRLRV